MCIIGQMCFHFVRHVRGRASAWGNIFPTSFSSPFLLLLYFQSRRSSLYLVPESLNYHCCHDIECRYSASGCLLLSVTCHLVAAVMETARHRLHRVYIQQDVWYV